MLRPSRVLFFSPQARAYYWAAGWLRVVVDSGKASASMKTAKKYLKMKKSLIEASAKHARFKSMAYLMDVKTRCDGVMIPA